MGIFLGFPRERWILLWELTISGWRNEWITITWQCFIKSDFYEYIILWDIWVTNDHDYVPYVVIIIWPFPYWWIISGFVTMNAWGHPRSVGLYTVFSHHCVSFCLFFFWPLYYQFFFDWRLMLTTLVSSSFSSNVIWRGFLFVVSIRFVNIAQSVDHHCLSFPFIA